MPPRRPDPANAQQLPLRQPRQSRLSLAERKKQIEAEEESMLPRNVAPAIGSMIENEQREALRAELTSIRDNVLTRMKFARHLNPATVAPLVGWYLLSCARASDRPREITVEEYDLAQTILAALPPRGGA